MPTLNEQQSTKAALVVAFRILELPAPLSDTVENEAIVQAAELILGSIREYDSAIVLLESAIERARNLRMTVKGAVVMDQASSAIANLARRLELEKDCATASIWETLPVGIRALALEARQEANAALLELLRCEGEERPLAKDYESARDLWNHGEALRSEAILWDIAGAEAFGIELGPLPDNDEM